jgi:queuosine biosynthesis protein QueD
MNNVTITKEFMVHYAHIVPNAYCEPCRTIHGHSAKIAVHLCGRVDNKTGMIMDFKQLKEYISPVIDMFDHSVILNESDKHAEYFYKNFERVLLLNCDPTAENLSTILYKEINDVLLTKIQSTICSVFKVDFWETSSAYASCTNDYDNTACITKSRFTC